jgi:hypothetical protein
MQWQVPDNRIVRIMFRVPAGVVLGIVPGALYAGLVALVHLGAYGHWDRVPTFALGCIAVGAVVGLLGGFKWALSGQARPAGNPPPASQSFTRSGQESMKILYLPGSLAAPAPQQGSVRSRRAGNRHPRRSGLQGPASHRPVSLPRRRPLPPGRW